MPSHAPSFSPTPVTPESRPRSIAALTITCLLLVVVPAMVALIGYRSVMVHSPTTALVIAGDASLNGAEIQVHQTLDPHGNWSSELTADNEWQSPILLDPGLYHVTVTLRGKTILNDDFAPTQLNGVRIDLPSMVTVIGNSSMERARVEIQSLGTFTSPGPRTRVVHLSPQDRYREQILLPAGEYRATARMPGSSQYLAQVDFNVDRKSPVHVDLANASSTQPD